MCDKEFTLEIRGSSIFCSREPETPEELSRLHAALIRVQSQLMDKLVEDTIKNGMTKDGVLKV